VIRYLATNFQSRMHPRNTSLLVTNEPVVIDLTADDEEVSNFQNEDVLVTNQTDQQENGRSRNQSRVRYQTTPSTSSRQNQNRQRRRSHRLTESTPSTPPIRRQGPQTRSQTRRQEREENQTNVHTTSLVMRRRRNSTRSTASPYANVRQNCDLTDGETPTRGRQSTARQRRVRYARSRATTTTTTRTDSQSRGE